MRTSTKIFAFLLAATLHSASAQNVGFQTTSIPVADGTPIPVDIWYPTAAPATAQPLAFFQQTVAANAPVQGTAQGAKLHLIVISHGNGGTKDGHYDTALALAKAGFVVAALEHTGDNYHDQSRATDIRNRPRELHRLIDFMLTEWPNHAALDTQHVGAFGFSSGGFTVLAAAGGDPDLSLTGAHCAAHPKFFDCQLVKAHPLPPATTANAKPEPIVHDPRISVLVVAAPALGYTFAHGLSSVTQPTQLWRADEDQILPAPEYADAVKASLPNPPDFHTVPNAGHFDFLAPCTPKLAAIAPPICTSRPGFDREAFHKSFDEAVVAFFVAHLR